jgi:hypothetical protein
MISVDCPRCGKVWYSEEEEGGTVRLCADCSERLRGKRRSSPFRLDAFAVVALVLTVVDVFLIALAHVFPDTLGGFLAAYGAVLLLFGMLGLRSTMLGHWYLTDVDWSLGRWPLLMALLGLACVLAFASLVLPQR